MPTLPQNYVATDYWEAGYEQTTLEIDWPNRSIFIPKFFTDLVTAGPPEVRDLDTDLFRKTINDLADEVDGMPFPTTHNHTAPFTTGGTTFARVIEFINNYTITFEESSPAYAVNLQGSNNNITDVAVLNSTQIRSQNSGGLVESKTSGLTAAESATLEAIRIQLANKRGIDTTTGIETVYEDDQSTSHQDYDLWADTAETTRYDGTNGINVRTPRP